MRLPEESRLSREQREVCQAPSEGTMLVIGPPGSGKTVVAIFRKGLLEALDEPVEAVAWNNVLARYGSLDMTFESWHNGWWKKATEEVFPAYFDNGYRRPDYKAALEQALGAKKQKISANGNWGHLILDEAQDFPVTAHSLLAVSGAICSENAKYPPSLLILADENQRISDGRNSTLEEIRKAHYVTLNDQYLLTKNYRNTREIASVAAHFFVGAKSGVPELPEERGDKPKLLTSCSMDDAVERIVNHARNHEDHDIGVLVYYENTRKKLFNKLKYHLSETDIQVQTYFSNSRKGGGKQLASSLKFDQGSMITVLCYASSKGLEFDSVFLPELQQLTGTDGDGEISKMQLYVMASRARSQLTIMLDDPSRKAPIWRLLPGNNQLNDLFDVN